MIIINNELFDELLSINKNLIVPNYLIKYYSKFDFTIDEFILVLYFINNSDNLTFDINKISNDLSMDAASVLDIISNLTEKNIISIDVKKNNGIIEEYISLDLLLNRIKMFYSEHKSGSIDNSIYDLFEQEFGRTLSPTEYETITNWIECNISVDLIKAALKEAVLNGVNSLRYIDKILFEWNKKGYKSSDDIIRKKTKNDDYVEELYDYDWLNN